MRNQERILEAYRAADNEGRLNLFLECPALRNTFIKMETHREVGPTHNPSRPGFWRRLFSGKIVL